MAMEETTSALPNKKGFGTKQDVAADSPMSPQEALRQFEQNPIGFIQGVIDQVAGQHLDTMREQIELQSALFFARKHDADFQRFEPYILQELARLIQNDEDGILDPWPDLIERAKDQFRQKFVQLAQSNPHQLQELLQVGKSPAGGGTTGTAYQEKATNRRSVVEPGSFSRKAIASMSMDEFLEQEEAINQALRDQRIR